MSLFFQSDMTRAVDFHGRTVLLTGASRGIGRQMARQLVQRGAYVLAVARPSQALDSLVESHPGSVTPLACDLGAEGAAAKLGARVVTRHPECSVLINNAAIMHHTRLTLADWEHPGKVAEEVALNLTAPLQLVAALLPLLVTHPGGAICNVTSGLAISPTPEAATYCATKSGLRQFTKALRWQCEDAGMELLVSEAVMTLVDTTLSRGDPARKLAPARAAAEVLAGLEAGRPEIWVERTRLLRRIWRLSPALADRIMRGPRQPQPAV